MGTSITPIHWIKAKFLQNFFKSNIDKLRYPSVI